MNFIKLTLTESEKITLRLHVWYSVIEGFIVGILALNEFVFIKSLKGNNYQLGLLFQFSVILYVFLIFLNEILKRVKDKRKLLRYTALFTRLPLMLLFFFPRSSQGIAAEPFFHILFLLIFFVYYAGMPIIYPNINLFLKNAYRNEHFGRLYGFATSLNKIVMVVVTLLYGILLDYDNFAFRYIFPAVAIFGVISVYLLSLIEFKEEITALTAKDSFFTSVKSSFSNMLTILKNNKPYLHFEAGFMIYGFSFMISVTVITIYFDKALHLNYSSVAFYKNVYNIAAIIMLPFFSKLIDRIDPRKFAMITFASIMLFILSLALTDFFPQHVELYGIKLYYTMIPYLLFQSVFAATMSLLWSIGSAYFCRSSQAGDYQSVHLSLTGLRAVFAPTSGVIIYELFGFFTTFMLAVFALLIAILLMFWSYRRDKLVIPERLNIQNSFGEQGS
ncbi:MAG: MFS transporter [Bacteroidetes bacterium]|nr:MFS transporter [Bacteroidota bacterium]